MSSPTAASIFAALARELATAPGVELAEGPKKSFGSGTLKVNGKIFAMVTSAGHFVVKLPRARVDALALEGAGSRFDPGHGRLMKEWLQVAAPQPDLCRALAREALGFVSSAT